MKDNQHEQMFTELTPAEAAVIEGGKTVIDSTIDFDFALDSRKFAVTATDPRVSLSIGSLTSSGEDGKFTATLKRVRPGGTIPITSRNVFSGARVTFGSQPVGEYLIQFTDKKDSKKVAGPIQIVVG